MTNPDKIALPAFHLCSRNMSCMKEEHKRLGRTKPLWYWLKVKDQIYERSVLSLPLQSRKAQMHLGCGKRWLRDWSHFTDQMAPDAAREHLPTTICKQESEGVNALIQSRDQPVAKLLRCPTSTRLLIFLLIFPGVSYIDPAVLLSRGNWKH